MRHANRQGRIARLTDTWVMATPRGDRNAACTIGASGPLPPSLTRTCPLWPARHTHVAAIGACGSRGHGTFLAERLLPLSVPAPAGEGGHPARHISRGVVHRAAARTFLRRAAPASAVPDAPRRLR